LPRSSAVSLSAASSFVDSPTSAREPLGAAGPAFCEGLGLGHRRLPHVGAGVGACVVMDGVGVGFGVGDLVGFATGFLVGPGALDEWVTTAGVALVPGALDRAAAVPELGGFVVGATVVGATVGVGVGLSLTRTRRLGWSPPPTTAGMRLSGSAWKPMNASSPVATVASMTITTLDSRGPRCALPVTVATSPQGWVAEYQRPIGTNSNTLYWLAHVL
jgi:hypothetical protein